MHIQLLLSLTYINKVLDLYPIKHYQMAPNVEDYRDQYECMYDGETVLRAASIGIFSDDVGKTAKDEGHPHYAHLPNNYILRELGVKIGMGRNKICKKLGKIIELKKQKKLNELAEEEASMNPDLKDAFIGNVTPFPGMEERYKEQAVYDVARNRILAVLAKVKNFCEDSKDTTDNKNKDEPEFDHCA